MSQGTGCAVEVGLKVLNQIKRMGEKGNGGKAGVAGRR